MKIWHFPASVGTCNLILHILVVVNNIIDSCQNRVSADQYHITILQTQVSSRRGCFFEVIRLQVTSFQLIPGSTPSDFLYNGYKVYCVR